MGRGDGGGCCGGGEAVRGGQVTGAQVVQAACVEVKHSQGQQSDQIPSAPRLLCSPPCKKKKKIEKQKQNQNGGRKEKNGLHL